MTILEGEKSSLISQLEIANSDNSTLELQIDAYIQAEISL
jgi:hypothetical protein